MTRTSKTKPDIARHPSRLHLSLASNRERYASATAGQLSAVVAAKPQEGQEGKKLRW